MVILYAFVTPYSQNSPWEPTLFLTRFLSAINAKLKELIKLSNLCNFELFACNIEGSISHQKQRNFCFKKVNEPYILTCVKFRAFRRKFLRSDSVYWAQMFRDN